MRHLLLCLILLAPGVADARDGFTRRCGWLINPTPGNYSLEDREKEWTLGTQGSDPAQGFEMPDIPRAKWQKTTDNGYGHACACVELKPLSEEAETMDARDVEAVRNLKILPLTTCRADKALPKEEGTSQEAATPTVTLTRCGWYSVPSPGNAWLLDAKDNIALAVAGQHGYVAPGDYADGKWPTFPKKDWIADEGDNNTGYGCLCLQTEETKDGSLVGTHDAKARPLSACRNDKALKDREPLH